MKTYSVKASEIKREWHVIDADGQILGRLATRVANLLQGKHKPMFVRNLDVGDYVIVINAAKIKVTGAKELQKLYRSHSLYPRGFKEVTYERMMAKDPTRVISHAVRGMLPQNRIGDVMMKKCRVFAGSEHTHEAQVKAGAVKEVVESPAKAAEAEEAKK